MLIRSSSALAMVAGLLLSLSSLPAWAKADEKAAPPKVGDMAPDFDLNGTDGKRLKMSEMKGKGPIVLVMLRGYPGYQCPMCQKQFGSFMEQAEAFAKADAQVIFVYPGMADDLMMKAKEFQGKREMPKGMHLAVDEQCKMAKACGLRWDATNETAYPCTMVIDRDGKIVGMKMSKTHGDRMMARDAMEMMSKMMKKE